MEQCVKRPPEKVLIMPNTTHSAPRTSSANTKKPARARASLLSIISAGTEQKEPNKSVSSDKDEVTSPVVAGTSEVQTPSIGNSGEQPASTSSVASITQTTKTIDSSHSELPQTELDSESAKKKVPPPTLAKPSRGKPPPTAAKPAKSRVSRCSDSASATDTVVERSESEVFSPSEEKQGPETSLGQLTQSPPADIPSSLPSLADNSSPVVNVTVAELAVKPAETLVVQSGEEILPQLMQDNFDTASEGIEVLLPVPPQSSSDVDKSTIVEEVVVEEQSPMLKSHSVPKPVDVIAEDIGSSPNKGDITPPLIELNSKLAEPVIMEELPPPPPPDSMTEFSASELDIMPPVPPVVDESIAEDMEFPPPPEMDFVDAMQDTAPENNASIDEAVDRITSKYDISQNAVNSNHSVNETQEGSNLNMSKHTFLTKGSESESVNIHAASQNFNSSSSSEASNSQEEGRGIVSGKPVLSELKLKLEERLSVCVDKTPSISSPLSEIGQSESSSDEAVMSATEDENSKLPATSGRSDATEAMPMSPEPISQVGDEDEDLHQVAAPTISVMNDRDGTLTPAEPTDHSPAPSSSSVSPAPHSPPLNTSSESGDSGIENSVYTLIGETVPVKLRSTTNDNRKSDKSVPMFERNSSELKRVTFRENSNQVTPTSVSLRSEAEQAQIKKTGLTDDEISQAELFYKGHKTEVMACPCLGTLYFTESTSSENIPVTDWKPEHVGIPVLIYNTGDGKRSRGLTLVFAEKGTGFLLWKTVINYESRWEVVEPVFHRLRIPGTADKLAGIAYQDEASAEKFYKYFKLCTSDPEKNVLNNPNLRNKKKKEKKKSIKHHSISLPSKSAISKPCQFTHVTQLKQSEEGILALAMVPVDEEGSEDGVVN